MVGRRVAGSPQLWESFSLSLPIHLRNYLKSGIQMFRNSNVQKFQASKDQNSAKRYLVQFFSPVGWLETCALILCLLILLQVQNKTFCTYCICPAWCLIRSKIKVMISLGHFIIASDPFMQESWSIILTKTKSNRERTKDMMSFTYTWKAIEGMCVIRLFPKCPSPPLISTAQRAML